MYAAGKKRAEVRRGEAGRLDLIADDTRPTHIYRSPSLKPVSLLVPFTLHTTASPITCGSTNTPIDFTSLSQKCPDKTNAIFFQAHVCHSVIIPITLTPQTLAWPPHRAFPASTHGQQRIAACTSPLVKWEGPFLATVIAPLHFLGCQHRLSITE